MSWLISKNTNKMLAIMLAKMPHFQKEVFKIGDTVASYLCKEQYRLAVHPMRSSQKLKLIRCCRSVRCGKKIGISTVRYLPLILKKFWLEFLWFGFQRKRRNLTTSLSSAVKHRWICTNGFTGINLVLILESCVQCFHYCRWFRRQIKVSFAT